MRCWFSMGKQYGREPYKNHSARCWFSMGKQAGLVHAWVGQIVTFGQYGLPACPYVIFDPGNRFRRVKLVLYKSPLVLWEG